MDFRTTAEQDALREEVRQFLRENPPDKFPLQLPDFGMGFGAWSYEFSRKLGETGWISMTWPKEYGGQERPLTDKLVVWEELASHGAPFAANFYGETLAPTIIEYGSERLKKELLPKIATSEKTFWMAFSEPDAGSDLLALTTQAVRENNDYFILNGQKVWSSSAHLSDYGYLVARTAKSARRHEGLSLFIIDKTWPGITIRPLYSITGAHLHNEVYFDDVRVPRWCLIGKENEGFKHILDGLEADRFWGRFPHHGYCSLILNKLVKYVLQIKKQGIITADTYQLLRQKLAERAIEIEICRLMYWRLGSLLEKKHKLTFEAAGAKVFTDEMGQRLYATGMEILGLYGQLAEGTEWAPLKGEIEFLCLAGVGQTIGGGTTELMKNTIARLGLRLPRD